MNFSLLLSSISLSGLGCIMWNFNHFFDIIKLLAICWNIEAGPLGVYTEKVEEEKKSTYKRMESHDFMQQVFWSKYLYPFPKFICWSTNFQCAVFGDGANKEVIKIKWRNESRA